jgi:hypothetical protein
MSDFLSNLIARSFTDAPVIQPRVPSLFETKSNEFLDEQHSSTLRVPASETISPASVPESSAMRTTVAPRSEAEPRDARAEQSLIKPHTIAHEKAPVVAPARQLQTEAAETREVEVKTSKASVPASSSPDERKDSDNKERVFESFSEVRPIQPRRRKDFSPIEQRPSTSAPRVRVTIGRIEVRAIHPPAHAPKPTKPAPPRISLEDYLRKREGGSR